LWEQVVGQEPIVNTLQNAIRSGRVGHAYLFAGPRGTGKTTTARLLAKAVNCQSDDPAKRPCDLCEHCRLVNENRFMDLIEIDAASNTSVDDVRDLRDKIGFAPTQGQFKVYIIDEVHMLSTAAFNALLKTLEEPPAHAIFILATTEVHKIPATVLSRCQRHEFRRISVQAIVRLLRDMAEKEGLTVEDAALTLIARQSTGAMRDGISLLDQLASTGQAITLQMAQTVLGTATNQLVIELIDAVTTKDSARGLNAIHTALDSGTDSRQFARQIVDYLRSLLLISLGNADQVDATEEMRAQMARHAQSFSVPRLTETLRLFNTAASETRSGWQPGLLLELALAEALEEKQLQPVTLAPAAQAESYASRPQPARPAVPVTPEEPPAVPLSPSSALFQDESQPAPAEAHPHRKPGKAQAQAAKPEPMPEPEPEPEPATAQTPAGPAPDLTVIKKSWDQVRQLVKKHRPQTEALLNSCKSVTVRNGVLVLGFATDVVKAKMETNPDNLRLVQWAVTQATGGKIPVTCAVVDARTNAVPDDLAVDADGMVGTALDLGAKIVQKE
jgi:DNA polymerase-3 subunit gamma/tau